MFRGSVKGTATHPIHQFPLHFPPMRHLVPSHFNWPLPLILVRNPIRDMVGTVLASLYSRINPDGTPAANLPSNKFNALNYTFTKISVLLHLPCPNNRHDSLFLKTLLALSHVSEMNYLSILLMCY